MLDRLVETFCETDDFCNEFLTSFQSNLLESGTAKKTRGPKPGLCESEVLTILICYHSSRYKDFKSFYERLILDFLKPFFPGAPSYNRFFALMPNVAAIALAFLWTKRGTPTGIYYIDSTPLPVCNNLRINRHKVFKHLAARGKSSTGWFFGFKLHLVFNHIHEIVAMHITPGNVHDIKPVETLMKGLTGKLFGDKGYLSKKLFEALWQQGVRIFTRVRKKMTVLPMETADKALLNGRNMVETAIGHIKEFSSLRLPKHRSVANAFTHIAAALISYQLNPITPKPAIYLP